MSVILLIEDDQRVANLIKRGLEEQQYIVDQALDSAAGGQFASIAKLNRHSNWLTTGITLNEIYMKNSTTKLIVIITILSLYCGLLLIAAICQH